MSCRFAFINMNKCRDATLSGICFRLAESLSGARGGSPLCNVGFSSLANGNTRGCYGCGSHDTVILQTGILWRDRQLVAVCHFTLPLALAAGSTSLDGL